MRAFDFASRVARLFATRGAVLQNADIRKFAPKRRQHCGEELAFNVVNEDVFLRNARLIDELANDGQNHWRGRVAKIVLFARSAVVQVDFDRDDFTLLVPAFEFSGRLVEMTEDFVPSVAVGVGAGQRLEGDRDHFFAFIAVGVFVEPPLGFFSSACRASARLPDNASSQRDRGKSLSLRRSVRSTGRASNRNRSPDDSVRAFCNRKDSRFPRLRPSRPKRSQGEEPPPLTPISLKILVFP